MPSLGDYLYDLINPSETPYMGAPENMRQAFYQGQQMPPDPRMLAYQQQAAQQPPPTQMQAPKYQLPQRDPMGIASQSENVRNAFYEGAAMPPDPRMAGWAGQEDKFQAGIRDTPWFNQFKARHGEEPNLNDPNYDYRSAWGAGERPDVRDPEDGMLHWSSRFKGPNHPNRYVNGRDTITNRRR